MIEDQANRKVHLRKGRERRSSGNSEKGKRDRDGTTLENWCEEECDQQCKESHLLRGGHSKEDGNLFHMAREI